MNKIAEMSKAKTGKWVRAREKKERMEDWILRMIGAGAIPVGIVGTFLTVLWPQGGSRIDSYPSEVLELLKKYWKSVSAVHISIEMRKLRKSGARKYINEFAKWFKRRFMSGKVSTDVGSGSAMGDLVPMDYDEHRGRLAASLVAMAAGSSLYNRKRLTVDLIDALEGVLKEMLKDTRIPGAFTKEMSRLQRKGAEKYILACSRFLRALAAGKEPVE